MVKLLIDECLHTSLVDVAHRAGHVAHHVAHLGMSGSKDWQLMKIIAEGGYTFVTNNRSDFLAIYNREAIHAGLIVIVPSVRPARQAELFEAALAYLRKHDPLNTVIEADFAGGAIVCRPYRFPAG